MNKPQIYDAALALWGYDAQVLKTAEECSELASCCARFINHRANGNAVAEEAADVEIMIEQLRHNGMNDMIEQQKARKLARLSRRVGIEAEIVAPFTPAVCELLADAREHLDMAEAMYLDNGTNSRHAAKQARLAIGLLMHAAQKMIAEQQRREAAR